MRSLACTAEINVAFANFKVHGHVFRPGDKPGSNDHAGEASTMRNTDHFGWQEPTDPIYKSILVLGNALCSLLTLVLMVVRAAQSLVAIPRGRDGHACFGTRRNEAVEGSGV